MPSLNGNFGDWKSFHFSLRFVKNLYLDFNDLQANNIDCLIEGFESQSFNNLEGLFIRNNKLDDDTMIRLLTCVRAYSVTLQTLGISRMLFIAIDDDNDECDFDCSSSFHSLDNLITEKTLDFLSECVDQGAFQTVSELQIACKLMIIIYSLIFHSIFETKSFE